MNAVTVKDAFPVPDVKDAMDSLRVAKYFATIDLLSGYWQLGTTDRARERSAFARVEDCTSLLECHLVSLNAFSLA